MSGTGATASFGETTVEHRSGRRRSDEHVGVLGWPSVVRIAPAALLALALGCGDQQPSTGRSDDFADTSAPVSETELELRVGPLVDLYYELRDRAAEPEAMAVPPDYADAVAALRRIQEFFGAWGGWGPVDTVFLGADGLDDVRAWAEGLPDPVVRRGREIALQQPALELVAALDTLLPVFMERDWPARRDRLQTAIATFERNFLPRHRQALAYMLGSLGIADPGIDAPVYLVSTANPPGAFTYYLRGGQPASVISVAPGVNAVLFEVMLHESTHVLDMASDEESSVFVTLRQLLEQAGVGPDDPRYHDVPHMLMFVQAGETMRRLYDPQHEDYGAVTTLYARSEPLASIAREVWRAHLDGDLERDAALQTIVERVVAADASAPE